MTTNDADRDDEDVEAAHSDPEEPVAVVEEVEEVEVVEPDEAEPEVEEVEPDEAEPEDYDLIDDVDDDTDEPVEVVEEIEEVEMVEEVEPDEAEPEAQAAPDDAVEEEAQVEAIEWYQNRWRDIQTGFVDAPRDAVANADRLVADVIDQLTTALVEERNKLAEQWSQDAASTEDLRVAFQGYRSFFERLVTT